MTDKIVEIRKYKERADDEGKPSWKGADGDMALNKDTNTMYEVVNGIWQPPCISILEREYS